MSRGNESVIPNLIQCSRRKVHSPVRVWFFEAEKNSDVKMDSGIQVGPNGSRVLGLAFASEQTALSTVGPCRSIMAALTTGPWGHSCVLYLAAAHQAPLTPATLGLSPIL